MLENMTWELFKKTGSIELFLEYKNIQNISEKNSGAMSLNDNETNKRLDY